MVGNISLALGSNIGDRRAAMKAAVTGLAPFFEVEKVSPVYETAAAYVTDQPDFLNMALIGHTDLTPIELLHALKKLEGDLGRTTTFRYGPRLLDMDIIYYGNVVLQTPELVLPHPKLHEREFVLRPLADIMPDFIDPVRGLGVAAMLATLETAHPSCLGDL